MSILDDIVLYLDQPTRYENYIASRCPFHDDSRPSFFVYEDGFFCKSCGKRGSIKALQGHFKKGLVRYKEDEPKWRNPWTKWLKQQSLGQILKSSWETLKNNPSMGKYLTDRSIPIEDQIRLGIGYRDGYFTFPIRNERGKIVGAVARAESNKIKSKYVIPARQNPNLLYVPDWKLLANRFIFLTFGILDAMSLAILGSPAMSTTSGKNLDYTTLNQFRKRIYIIPDLGEEREASALASSLGWRGVVLDIHYPNGCKDINDILIHHKETLVETLREFNNG